MEPRTIVAIEIASSKIKGAVGTYADGRLSVLAVEQIQTKNNVRYGRVQNIREVTTVVNEIIHRLEKAPTVAPRKIQAVVISVGGRSITGTPAKSSLRFQHECEITENHVQRLIYEATRDFVGDKAIIDTLPRKFFVNNAVVKRVVGTFGETIKGEFMMVTAGKETPQNLRRIKLDFIDPENIFYQLRPTAIADFALTSAEKEVGAALVDFGAETTTVAVYKDGTLSFLSTIPMGSRLLTLDLMAGLGIAEEAAENFKITLGNVGDEEVDDDTNAMEVNAYVKARAGEIAANIMNQINLSGVPADTLSKIVLTGGGAKLPEFPAMLSQLTKLPVRVADMPADIVFKTAGCNNPDNIDIVALLAASRDLAEPDCLTPAPKVEQAPVYVPVESPVMMDDIPVIIHNEPVRTVVDEVPEYRETITEREESEERNIRRSVSDSEEDLLKDDPDDETEEEEEKVEPDRRSIRKGGIFGFGKKSKQEPEEEIRYDEEEEEETEDEAEEGEPIKNVESAKQTLNRIGNLFVKFFTPPEDDSDDNE